MSKKRILLLDFDGVIHSYRSGWKGARVIPDPPVDGALAFLIRLIRDGRYQVCIYSARSCQWGGKRAMKKWLRHQFMAMCPSWGATPEPFRSWIGQTAFADPWEDEVDWAAKLFVRAIDFPTRKPPAFLTIDDRAICFDGHFDTLMGKIAVFMPWNGKGV